MNALDEVALELAATGGELEDVKPLADGKPLFFDLLEQGSATREAAREYEYVFESVLEGYLMHTGTPRLHLPDDQGLKLIAGDFLYAVGLQRLARLDDLEAVGLLADLITLASRLHVEGGTSGQKGTLWLATVAAVAFRPAAAIISHWPFHEAATGSTEAADRLLTEGKACAEKSGTGLLFSNTFEETHAALSS